MANNKQNLWQTVQFKNFAKLQRGFDLPQQDRINGKYPVVASTSITAYHNQYKVNAPCVTTGRSGSLGAVLYINVDCWPLNTVLWVKDFHGNNPKFVYYKLKTLNLEKFNAGAGVPTLNKNHLDTLNIEIPDVPTQTRIASVLSTYDELIKNNEKRITALEEMSQLLYTEWFVKFKFRGHEKVKFFDSSTEYDKIPEGWRVNTIEKVFEILGGGTPSRTSAEYWGGEINWYTPSDLTSSNQMFTDRSLEQITELGLIKSSAKLFPPNSIMLTSRATIGAISINTFPSTTNQGFIVCIPNEKTPLYYLYYWLKQHVPLFIKLGTGATFKEISKGNFKKINILIPDTKTLNEFENKLKVIGDMMLHLQRKNKVLSQIRDILIPQLVTGRLSLKL